MNTPTIKQYQHFQLLFDYWNHALFNNELPVCMLTLSEASPRICAYFAESEWTDDGRRILHTINLNPLYLSKATDIEICQTVVHEQVHLWQHEFGQPSRGGYHNKMFAERMELIGLMTSDTGKPDGKRTGQTMSDYPIPGGRFEKAFARMPRTLLLPFRRIIGKGKKPSKSKNKVKYTCPECQTNIWGKPGLEVICSNCYVPLLPPDAHIQPIITTDPYKIAWIILENRIRCFQHPESHRAMIDFLLYVVLGDKMKSLLPEVKITQLIKYFKFVFDRWKQGAPPFQNVDRRHLFN